MAVSFVQIGKTMRNNGASNKKKCGINLGRRKTHFEHRCVFAGGKECGFWGVVWRIYDDDDGFGWFGGGGCDAV